MAIHYVMLCYATYLSSMTLLSYVTFMLWRLVPLFRCNDSIIAPEQG